MLHGFSKIFLLNGLSFLLLMLMPLNESVSAQELSRLRGTTWQWTRLQDPTQHIQIEEPSNYTLKFAPDGNLAVKADCNRARGSYKTGKGSSISIKLGPMTLVACTRDSRGNEFVKKLEFVRHFFFRDDNLFMDLMADGGTMEFTRVETSELQPKVDDYSFRHRIEVVDSLFQRAQESHAKGKLSSSEYRSLLMLLRDEERSIYQSVRNYHFNDITEGNYWIRSRLKFPSRLDQELLRIEGGG